MKLTSSYRQLGNRMLCLTVLFVLLDLTAISRGFSQQSDGQQTKRRILESLIGSTSDLEKLGAVPKLYASRKGYLSYVRAEPGKTLGTSVASFREPESIARTFMADNGVVFGVSTKKADFQTLRTKNKSERAYVRLQQTYAGIPVFAGEVIVQVKQGHGVEAVLCDISLDLQLMDSDEGALVAKVSKRNAQEIAQSAAHAEAESFEITTSDPQLFIYDPDVLGNSGTLCLVWRVEVVDLRNRIPVTAYFVDAHSGAIAFHHSLVKTAKYRRIYDSNLNPLGGALVRSEGDVPSGIYDADLAYDYLGDAYDFYSSHHGRDGIDNAGSIMNGMVRSCDPFKPSNCAWANAKWILFQGTIYFGPGFTADDVVGHELTHGVTDFESALVYSGQSGAINESFSDIWGEFIDLENNRGNDSPNVRWKIGEDLPGGWIRDMKDPIGQPDRTTSDSWYSGSDDNGGVHTNSGVGNKLAYLLTDGDYFNTYSIDSMGVSRVASLFYEVQTNLLTSGADYWQLYTTLTQAAVNLNWTTQEIANLEKACAAVEICPPFPGIYAIRSNLTLGQFGAVSFDVRAPRADDFYVRVWDANGWSAPKWDWVSSVSELASLQFAKKHDFSLTVKPTDQAGQFQVWLYEKDLLGLYRIIQKIPFDLVAGPNDTTPPIVQFATPSAGQTVSGIVTFSANSTDQGSGVNRVEFYVNNVLLATDLAVPYECMWDATVVPTGSYSITAKAYDNAGNMAEQTISVNVLKDALYAGTVTPASGATTDLFAFNVWYRSTGPPTDVKLHLSGQPITMTTSESTWSQGVKFVASQIGFSAGTYQYYFTATANGATLRYPDGTGSLSFNVIESQAGWDLAISTTGTHYSPTPINPGNTITVSCDIKNLSNSGNTYTNVPLKAELFDLSGQKLDTSSTTIPSIPASPSAIQTYVLQLHCPSNASDGTYAIVISVLPTRDSKPANNTHTLNFYVGPPMSNEQYAAPGEQTTLSTDETLTINGFVFTLMGENLAGDRYVSFRDPSGTTKNIPTGRIQIYSSYNSAIAVASVWSGGCAVLETWAISSGGPTFVSKAVGGFPGQRVTFDATAPSAYTFVSGSDNYEVYTPSGANEVQNWSRSVTRYNSNHSSLINFDIPSGAAQGVYKIYLVTNYDQSGANQHVTLLQITVQNPLPVITQLSKPLLSADDTIKISGTNFGTSGTVKFNDLPASQTTVWSNTSITCVVPEGVTSGNLFVTTAKGTSNGAAYVVLSATGKPVVAVQIPDQSIDAGTSKYIGALGSFFSDPNGNLLSYSASTSKASLTVNAESLAVGSLAVSAAPNIGDLVVTIVTARDPKNKTAADTFLVTIRNNTIAPPSRPTLSSPASGSTNQPTTLILLWKKVAGGSSYRLQVSTAVDFSSLMLDDSLLTDTMREVSHLQYATEYYWRVRAQNLGGTSAYSLGWTFQTAPAPISFSPDTINFGLVQRAQSKIDSVIVRNLGSLPLLVESVSSTSQWFAVWPTTAYLSSQASAKFYIRYTAEDAFVDAYPYPYEANIIFNHTAQGSPDSVYVIARKFNPVFRVESTSIDFGPVRLGTPKTDSVKVRIAGWDVYHTMRIDSVRSDNPAFSVSPNGPLTLGGEPQQPPPPYSKWYRVTFTPNREGVEKGNIVFWHDQPGSPDTVSVSGTGTALLNAPLLASPRNDSTILSWFPTVRWHPVVGATSYSVELCADAAMTLVDRAASGLADTLWPVNTSIGPGIWYWHVKAMNSAGSSEWSLPSRFEISTIHSGLVAYYAFDGTGVDASGGSRNGVATTTVPLQDRFSRLNRALAFDGTSSRVDCGAFNPYVNSFSLSLWFMTSNQNTPGIRTIVGDAEDSRGFRAYQSGTGVFVEIRKFTSQARTVGFQLTSSDQNQWIHLVAVSNNGSLRIYKNGELMQDQGGWLGDSQVALNLGIGYQTFQGPTNFWQGALDEIRIYDGELTEQQIKVLYGGAYPLSGSVTKVINTTGLWDFNQTHIVTAVSVNITSLSAPDTVTVLRFESNAPIDPFFTGGSPANVSRYRWVVSQTGLSSLAGEIRFSLSKFTAGINNPSTVTIYSRPTEGVGYFSPLPTAYNSPTNELVGSVTRFSEFIFGSNDPINPLPIQLSEFTAVMSSANSIRLDWTTESEINNYGFYVQRRSGTGGSFNELPNSFIPGHGTTNVPRQYAFTDTTAIKGDCYYRLKQVDLDGTVHFTDAIQPSGLTSVTELAPIVFALHQNYPNPFNPETEIKFCVDAAAPTTLTLYNTLGQRIATLFDNMAEPGQYYHVKLNGQNLASGVYLYRLQSGKRNEVKKLLLLR